MTETTTRPKMARCTTCGLYIGRKLLKPEWYDGHCPSCESAVDENVILDATQLRALAKRTAPDLGPIATRLPKAAAANSDIETLTEWRRDQKRTIRVGQKVSCQPKERKGTKKEYGAVTEIHSTGAIIVDVGALNPVNVDAEWVHVPNQKDT